MCCVVLRWTQAVVQHLILVGSTKKKKKRRHWQRVVSPEARALVRCTVKRLPFSTYVTHCFFFLPAQIQYPIQHPLILALVLLSSTLPFHFLNLFLHAYNICIIINLCHCSWLCICIWYMSLSWFVEGKSCLLAWEMRAFKRVDNVLMIYEWFWLLCVQFLSML